MLCRDGWHRPRPACGIWGAAGIFAEGAAWEDHSSGAGRDAAAVVEGGAGVVGDVAAMIQVKEKITGLAGVLETDNDLYWYTIL